MEIVLDKGFLQSFFTYNSSDRHKAVYEDFVKFVKKLQPGFTLITNYSTDQEMYACAAENPLLELLVEKVPHSVPNQDLTQMLKQRAYYEASCSLKLCLVNFSTKESGELESNFGYSFINGENLAYKWKPYLSDREEDSRCITSSSATPEMLRFDSWEKFDTYRHPVNSMLIVDNYILCDKSQQRIDQNLKPLLKSLLPKKNTELPVDITIITEQEPRASNFKAVQQVLVSYLEQELKELAFNLTIIRFDKNLLHRLKSEGYGIHDRRIITNYFWIESGMGFNIMNDRGKVKDSDSFINYKFNLLGHNHTRLQHMLKGYAAYAGIATEVYGSNKNRLLSQYHTTVATNKTEPAAATARAILTKP